MDQFNYEDKEDLEFRCKIMHLIADVMPNMKIPKPPQIEWLRIGSYNRVIGVAIEPLREEKNLASPLQRYTFNKSGSEPQPRRLALRMSLHKQGDIGDIVQDVTNLQVVGSQLTKLVPKLIGYDLTCSNALGKPYILQDCIRGQDLASLWETLNSSQRISALREVVKVTEKIAAITAPAAGLISARHLTVPKSSHIDLVCFPVPTRSAAVKYNDLRNMHTIPVAPQTPLEYILEHCERWHQYELRVGHETNRALWAQIIAMARSLNKRGWLGDCFHLVHNDLYPRNILIAVKSLTTVEITGIVDWDMCCFAPKFVALRAPYWAWMMDGMFEQNEDNARSEPTDNEGIEMKKAYHRTASSEYVRFGLSPEGVLARKIFYVLLNGMVHHRHLDFATNVIEEWNALHPDDEILSAAVPQSKPC